MIALDKKLFVVVLTTLILTLGSACTQKNNNQVFDHVDGLLLDLQPSEEIILTQDDTLEVSEEKDPSFFERSLELNSYLVVVNHPIERAYIEEEHECLYETQQTALYDKYMNLWTEEANAYDILIRQEILDSEDLLQKYEDYLDALDESISQELEFQEALQEELHSGGTVILGNNMRSKMELYRTKALKLIFVYDEIMVGRGWSWKNQVAD